MIGVGQERTAELATAVGLYRWIRGMSISDLAEAIGVKAIDLILLEIHHRDRLTDEQRQRLAHLVSV